MQHISEKIQAWLDGTLDVETAEAVLEHCRLCPGCDRELKQARAVWDLLAADVAPDPDRPIYLESLLPYHSFRWRGLRGVIEDGYKLVDSASPELYALFEEIIADQLIGAANNDSNNFAVRRKQEVERIALSSR